MDWVAIREKAIQGFKKYKYVLLVLALGLVLMSIPEPTEEMEPVPEPEAAAEPAGLEQRLSGILAQIDGVGKVQVLLTESTGEETIYQTDEDTSTAADSGSVRRETVTVTNADREEKGLVRKVNPPAYLGAVVVCQGAENPSVRLAVVEAVANATGISTDRITVLKMK